METKRINGFLFEKLLYNGLANLKKSEDELNSLNVFPVADGDTGTNMRMTLENGLRYAQPNEELCDYLSTLNEGLLLGARGNSGVILSQIFRGIHMHLSRCSAANCNDMRNALIQGYKTAYQAVINPVEGTILTVSREGIEHIRQQVDRSTSIETLFSMYVAEMRKSLSHTPEILDVLKASGVVDSGALGYITIIDGMSKYFKGEIFEVDLSASATLAPKAEEKQISFSSFNENSSFEKGYCMEFILQLLNSPSYLQKFNLTDYINEIKPFGDSIAVTKDKTRVKVHIHTKSPAVVITLSQRYGEFLTFKLENMQLQHNEHIEKQKAKKQSYSKPIGIIAVYNGEGIKNEFANLGCDATIDGGITMNPPSSEFLAAYESIDAENIIVLPNSKNVIGAAEQAAKLSNRKSIHVLPTKSIVEGYFAAAMDVGNSEDIKKRIESIKKGAADVTTLSIAPASKHYESSDVTCDPGDYIAVLNDKIVFSAKTPEDAFIGGFSMLENADERETCMVFCGESATDELNEKLSDTVYEKYPGLELTAVFGGQHTYIWTCGII